MLSLIVWPQVLKPLGAFLFAWAVLLIVAIGPLIFAVPARPRPFLGDLDVPDALISKGPYPLLHVILVCEFPAQPLAAAALAVVVVLTAMTLEVRDVEFAELHVKLAIAHVELGQLALLAMLASIRRMCQREKVKQLVQRRFGASCFLVWWSCIASIFASMVFMSLTQPEHSDHPFVLGGLAMLILGISCLGLLLLMAPIRVGNHAIEFVLGVISLLVAQGIFACKQWLPRLPAFVDRLSPILPSLCTGPLPLVHMLLTSRMPRNTTASAIVATIYVVVDGAVAAASHRLFGSVLTLFVAGLVLLRCHLTPDLHPWHPPSPTNSDGQDRLCCTFTQPAAPPSLTSLLTRKQLKAASGFPDSVLPSTPTPCTGAAPELIDPTSKPCSPSSFDQGAARSSETQVCNAMDLTSDDNFEDTCPDERLPFSSPVPLPAPIGSLASNPSLVSNPDFGDSGRQTERCFWEIVDQQLPRTVTLGGFTYGPLNAVYTERLGTEWHIHGRQTYWSADGTFFIFWVGDERYLFWGLAPLSCFQANKQGGSFSVAHGPERGELLRIPWLRNWHEFVDPSWVQHPRAGVHGLGWLRLDEEVSEAEVDLDPDDDKEGLKLPPPTGIDVSSGGISSGAGRPSTTLGASTPTDRAAPEASRSRRSRRSSEGRRSSVSRKPKRSWHISDEEVLEDVAGLRRAHASRTTATLTAPLGPLRPPGAVALEAALAKEALSCNAKLPVGGDQDSRPRSPVDFI